MRERFEDERGHRQSDKIAQLQERIAELEELNRSLMTSEAQYRSLVDNINIGVFRTAPEDGRPFIHVNSALTRILGYKDTAELQAARPISLYVHPEDRKAMIEAAHAQGGVKDWQVQMRRKDGSVITCSMTITMVRGPQGEFEYADGVLEDITEKVRMESELRASEAKYRQLVDGALEGIWAVDSEWNTTFVNDSMARMLGYASEEMEGRPIASFMDENGRLMVQELIARRGKGRMEVLDLELFRKDGSRIYARLSASSFMDDQDNYVGGIAFVSDVTARRRAEKDLQQSQQMLKMVLDTIPVSVFWKDRDLNYLGCNRKAALDAGLSDPAEIVGKNDHELAWRGSADIYQADDRAVIESGRSKINYEEPQRQEDGSIRWLETSKVPLRDTDGRVVGVLGTYEDVTERRKVEEELRESEGRFRTLTDSTFEAIVVHSNGIVLDINNTSIEQTGYTRDELIGHSILDFFTPESQEMVEGVIKQPVVEAYEAQLRRKDGEVRTVQIKGRVMEYAGRQARVATLVDITELVRARERIEELMARKESERKRLQTVLATLPVGVVIVDVSGVVVQSNERANDIWGAITLLKPKSTGDYRSLKAWWSDTGIPLKAEDWTVVRAIRESRTIIGDMIDVERLDESRGAIINSAAPILEQGKVVGGVVVTEDITKQRELEHDAIEAKERAELYIDLLTHDINNMNAAAKGYLQIMEEADDLDPKAVKWLTKSQGALADISKLIEKVKKIQSIEGPGSRRGLVDLGWMIEDVVQSFKELPGREVTLNYHPQLKRMVMAGELLSDVFANLIDNAIKHSNRPVTIDINIGRSFDKGREYHVVTVDDNGPGIPDEAKMRIFNRLQRGKTRASGSGLGLYLVKALVEDFQGEVWVEDRVPGDHTQGTRFVVMLPVAHEPEGGHKSID